jgi:alpha-ketoglutarate-dependent taurine dioxygenase
LAQRFEDVPPLTVEQVAALDLIDAVCEQLSMEFEMRPGDILIANNYDMLHARSAFRDQDVGAQGRHMLRIWMSIPNGRPLPQVLAATREFHHSYKRRNVG